MAKSLGGGVLDPWGSGDDGTPVQNEGGLNTNIGASNDFDLTGLINKDPGAPPRGAGSTGRGVTQAAPGANLRPGGTPQGPKSKFGYTHLRDLLQDIPNPDDWTLDNISDLNPDQLQKLITKYPDTYKRLMRLKRLQD